MTLATTVGGLGGLAWSFGKSSWLLPWLLLGGGVVVVGEIALIGYAYVRCLGKDPDLLRSERYNVTKLAIEKRLFGDNLGGLREVGSRTEDGEEPLVRLPDGTKILPGGDK